MYDFSEKKNRVSIPKEWFFDMLKYFLNDTEDVALKNKIMKGFEVYSEKQIERDLYTKFKTAATADEREEARKKYLDKKGIHKDFRW